MDEWQEFYQTVKDPSWPQCESIDQVPELPELIQVELRDLHGFFPSRFDRSIWKKIYFDWGIDENRCPGNYGLIDSLTGRIWMLGHDQDSLENIIQSFVSKKELLCVNLSTCTEIKNKLINNRNCLDWKVESLQRNDSQDIDITSPKLIMQYNDITAQEDDLQNQIMFYDYLWKKIYNESDYLEDQEKKISALRPVINDIFRSNIILSEICQQLLEFAQEIFDTEFEIAIIISSSLSTNQES